MEKTDKVVLRFFHVVEQYTIEITSLNGNIVYRKELEGPIQEINISSFEKGLYFLTIWSRDFVVTKKIIKQ